MIHHGEMYVKSKLFAMVPAVTCNAKGEDDGTCGEIEHLCTIELNYTGGIFGLPAL